MKNSTRTLLYIALIYFFILLLASCTKQEIIHQSPCDGNCGTYFDVVYENQVLTPNSNGYFEVDFNGLEYFQIKGQLTPLNEQYVINDVPMIESKFDSDYWVVFDSILFQTPMYSYLGWFNSNTLNTPIPFGNYTYTLNELINLHPPFNIAGYQVPKHFCTECPYAETIVGTYSKYNYHPTQNIFVDNEMVGDTINIFIETVFNTEGGIWYHGHDSPVPKEVIEDQIKIIVI
tara:strand:+ start:1261 stop:1956 length:696 start_codon:yes stop_codon:yes gene_type:complete